MRTGWLIVVAVAAILTALLYFAPPVLFVAREPGAIDPADYLFALRNPLRDRAPERAAEQVLMQLRDGRCMQALAFLSNDAAAICAKEKGYPPLTWSVGGREDSRNRSRIYYRATRRGLGWSNISITVERTNSGYRPVDYQAAY